MNTESTKLSSEQIAREIAELMGDDYPGPTPFFGFCVDLGNLGYLGIIEWWCRNQGVWITKEPDAFQVCGVGCVEWVPITGWDQVKPAVMPAFHKALLAAVRIAAEAKRG